MSIEVMTEVWKLDLEHPEQSVLLAMADHADDLGLNCYPSVGRLAWKTGYTERQVQRIMKDLRETGLIVPIGKGPDTDAMMYRIDLSRGIPKAPYVPSGRKLSQSMRRELVQIHDFVCSKCGQAGDMDNGPDGGPWVVDLIVPSKRGGRYTPDNVSVTCAKCADPGEDTHTSGGPQPEEDNGNSSGHEGIRGDISGHLGVTFLTFGGDIIMSPKPSLEPSGEPSGGCAGDFIAPANGPISENLEDFDTGEPRCSPRAAGPVPEFVPPEYWPEIAGLQGYRYRADSDAAFVEVLESTCAEHGVTPWDVVQAFSEYYAARPLRKGLVRPGQIPPGNPVDANLQADAERTATTGADGPPAADRGGEDDSHSAVQEGWRCLAFPEY